MTQFMKSIVIALKGKGALTFSKRVWTIGKRYGLTAATMDRSLERLAQLLQQYGSRATLPITAIALTRNGPVIQKYQAQGLEFAIHGYRHIDYSQLSLDEQKTHLQKARHIFQTHGIQAQGFRSPYLRRNEATLAALSQADFLYDSSASLVWEIETKHVTDSYQRVIGFYGAQPAGVYPALPYLDTDNNLVHIPYCLPDDEALIERLKWDSPEEINQIWPSMFRQIHRQGELFTLGLHPERTEECIPALAATLQEITAAGPAVWCAGLAEIAAWWKARTAAEVEISQIQPDLLQLTVNGPAGVTLLLRGLDARSASEPWFRGYRRASQMPCILHTSKRPFIGASPAASSSLINFLKQQGYIIEISTNPEAYSFYLDQSSFSREDERPLLAQVEEADFPLARLGRWPNGAWSAFNITGDIDALTFWDFSQRLWEQ